MEVQVSEFIERRVLGGERTERTKVLSPNSEEKVWSSDTKVKLEGISYGFLYYKDVDTVFDHLLTSGTLLQVHFVKAY